MHKSFLKFAVCAICTTIFIGCSRSSSEVSQSEWERLIAIRGEAREYCRITMIASFNRSLIADSNSVDSTEIPSSVDLIDELTRRENLRLLAEDRG